MVELNEYKLKIKMNNRQFRRVIIRQYYRLKHPDLNDAVILALVRSLNNQVFPVTDIKSEGGKTFEFVVVEPVGYEDKSYRVILVMCLTDDYLGVVNAFRVKRRIKK